MIFLKLQQHLNLLELYEEEICARIAQNLNLDALGPLKEFLHREDWESYLDKVESIKTIEYHEGNGQQISMDDQEKEEKQHAMEQVQRIEIATEIWQKMNQSALREQLYAAVLEFLKLIDEELHNSMCVEKYIDQYVAGFTKLLFHSSKLISIFTCDGINDENLIGEEQLNQFWNLFLENLRKIVHGFEMLVDPLKQRVQNEEISRKRALKLLVRSIPVSNINGYEHILYAIINCGYQKAKDLVENIYPNFIREYDYIKSSAQSRNQYFYICRPEDDVSAVIEMAMKNDVPPPNANVLNTRLGNIPPIHIRACNIDTVKEFPINLRPYQKELTHEAVAGQAMKNDVPPPNANVLNTRLGNIPPIHIRACNIDTVKEFPINLRPYQKELTHEAVAGQNVIITAPTGSGKTIVAAFIIREHLLKAIQRNQRAKACFIVPTNSLVHQQKRLFEQKIGHFAKVRELSGSGENVSLNNPIKLVILHADVVVITPQLLINELERIPMEIEQCSFKPFSLDIFSLIIFDESHHSKDEHPYNILMSHYHTMKQTGAHRGKLPQIIGMTASLGTGGLTTRDLDDAIRYILEICANMDSHWIACVRRHLESLLQYMPSVAEDIDYVGGHIDNLYLEMLLKQIDWLRLLMNQIPEATKNEISIQLNDRNGRDPLEQCFEHWLGNLQQGFLKITPILSDSSRERLMFCVDQMLLIYNAINLLNLFGPITAHKYINKGEQEKLRLQGAKEIRDEIRQWLAHLQSNICNIKDQYSKNSPLLNRLIEILNNQFIKNQNSRVLIFLKQRDHCQILSTLLNEQIQHNTDFFTGQASREEGGQNARMQKAKLEDFSKGIIKVLCATTVAEEGIDISACNLIIHYNYVTNEISRVQRRGRGRARDARSILLTCEQKIKEKEEQNALREQLMNQALDELARWPRTIFQQKVSVIIEKLYQKRKEKEALEKEKAIERRHIDSVYKIVCSECNRHLGLSTSIALAHSTYVITDRDFWVRTSAGPLPPEKMASRECKGNNPHIGEHRCSCNQKLGRIVQYRGGVLLPNLSIERIVFIRCRRDGTEPLDREERVTERKWAKVSQKWFHIEKITPLQLAEMKDAPKRPESLMRMELVTETIT